jgi:hypothetical protein
MARPIHWQCSFRVCLIQYVVELQFRIIYSLSSRRRAMHKSKPSSIALAPDHTGKLIHAVQKRRRQRFVALREVTRDEDDAYASKGKARASDICPVCQQTVPGDPDVLSAHIDACLAHMALQESSHIGNEQHTSILENDLDIEVDVDVDDGDPWEEITAVDGSSTLRMRRGGESARRLGFDVRDSSMKDVEADVDIEGEGDAVFGEAQFTEADIVDDSNLGQALQSAVVQDHLAAEAEIEIIIARSKKSGDLKTLVSALESKIKILVGAVPTI